MALREPDPRHQSIADQEVARFQQAQGIIAALRPGDPVIGEVEHCLSSLARRVENEFPDGAALQDSGMPNLATAIAHGITDHPTEDFKQLDGLITISLQWDLSPDRAARFLAELSDETPPI